jgi:hypothetical protein
VNQDVTYTFLRGLPTRITQHATPFLKKNRTKADLGIYVQDRWTIDRLTLNYGRRFNYFNGYVPRQQVPPSRFLGARDFAPVHGVPEWSDLNPRLGISYDIFGNGRTAVKTSFGRYVGKMAPGFGGVTDVNNPLNTSINSVNRAWNDANGNYVPDCELTNFSANGECGPIDNVNFGRLNPSAIRYDDGLIRGFGKRDYFWDLTLELQHELRSGTSATAGYYRNWTDHFGTGVLTGGGANIGWPSGHLDNLAVTPVDFQPYCVTAPVDPRLPGGGGYQVCGLYDVVPAKFGVGDRVFRRASDFERPDGGKGKSTHSDFFTFSVASRMGSQATLGASVDTGRTEIDQCLVVDSPQELLNCRVVKPFRSQTQIKINGSYELPGGFSVSGVLQNLSGITYNANMTVLNADIAPSLGRNLAACGTRAVCTASVDVPLVAPFTLFEPRRMLIDLRVSRSFPLGPSARLRANFDIYNVLNDSSLLGVNNTYGPNWRKPVVGTFDGGLVDGRLLQIGAQLTF